MASAAVSTIVLSLASGGTKLPEKQADTMTMRFLMPSRSSTVATSCGVNSLTTSLGSRSPKPLGWPCEVINNKRTSDSQPMTADRQYAADRRKSTVELFEKYVLAGPS